MTDELRVENARDAAWREVAQLSRVPRGFLLANKVPDERESFRIVRYLPYRPASPLKIRAGSAETIRRAFVPFSRAYYFLCVYFLSYISHFPIVSHRRSDEDNTRLTLAKSKRIYELRFLKSTNRYTHS